MYVRPISTRLLRGMLTPAMRAKASFLPLSLLVSRVLADDENPPVAADDLALLAHRLHRRSYLHGPFRLMIQTWALAAGAATATLRRNGTVRSARALPGLRARPRIVAKAWAAFSPSACLQPRAGAGSAAPPYAAARALLSCQGVRMRGPSSVTATVNSKWAA